MKSKTFSNSYWCLQIWLHSTITFLKASSYSECGNFLTFFKINFSNIKNVLANFPHDVYKNSDHQTFGGNVTCKYNQ